MSFIAGPVEKPGLHCTLIYFIININYNKSCTNIKYFFHVLFLPLAQTLPPKKKQLNSYA